MPEPTTNAPTPTDADLHDWEVRLVALARGAMAQDPAHDLGHLLRVWANARAIAREEPGADLLVVLAASLLHDLVNLPKNHPERAQASRLAAIRAEPLLREAGFPVDRLADTLHAIEAHAHSAGVEPKTAEARVVQDADRLDALGAIGVARCMAVAGRLGIAIADPEDPLAERRPLDDGAYALDHFATKLDRLPDLMRTQAGRRMARDRATVMREFRERLASELAIDPFPRRA